MPGRVPETTAAGDLSEQVAWLESYYRDRPSRLYRPGRTVDLDGNPIDERDNGQLQFHRAPHVIRQLAPGNGFGKTASVSVEIDWWGHGDHPFASEWSDFPRDRPRKMVWACQKHQQWDIIRPQIERWWPSGVVSSWVGQPFFRYTWPSGSTLNIITAETQWTTIQGIEPDVVVIDEEIPVKLWRELLKRRRGTTRTRYCVAATATQGLTWTHHELYLPWKKYHERKGIHDEREMMRRQGHRWEGEGLDALGQTPGIWCWPQGGHRDNPTATPETWAFYLATTQGNKMERHVRLFGGFREFAGSPVFDLEALEAMRPWQAEPGRPSIDGVHAINGWFVQKND